jgi:hypothetical protein
VNEDRFFYTDIHGRHTATGACSTSRMARATVEQGWMTAPPPRPKESSSRIGTGIRLLSMSERDAAIQPPICHPGRVLLTPSKIAHTRTVPFRNLLATITHR